MKRILLALLFLLCASTAHAQLFPIPVQQSNAAEGSHLFLGSTLSGIVVTWNAATTARYLMVFDGPVPSNGSVTSCTTTQAASCTLLCMYLSESTTAPNRFTLDYTLHPIPSQNGTGIGVALSTGAGCATITKDTTADFFYGQVR